MSLTKKTEFPFFEIFIFRCCPELRSLFSQAGKSWTGNCHITISSRIQQPVRSVSSHKNKLGLTHVIHSRICNGRSITVRQSQSSVDSLNTIYSVLFCLCSDIGFVSLFCDHNLWSLPGILHTVDSKTTPDWFWTGLVVKETFWKVYSDSNSFGVWILYVLAA